MSRQATKEDLLMVLFEMGRRRTEKGGGRSVPRERDTSSALATECRMIAAMQRTAFQSLLNAAVEGTTLSAGFVRSICEPALGIER